MRFKNPQTVRVACSAAARALADLFLQIRVGGDLALFQALIKALLELEASPGAVLDHDFIDAHTTASRPRRAPARALDWRASCSRRPGVARGDDRGARRSYRRRAERTIVCWAMGLTQHKHAVADDPRDRERRCSCAATSASPAPALCPVRGHCNVQGDRTMGICEKPRDAFLDALGASSASTPPREHGFDTVDAIRAMRDGQRRRLRRAWAATSLAATPDTEVTERGAARCRAHRAGVDQAQPLAPRRGRRPR